MHQSILQVAVTSDDGTDVIRVEGQLDLSPVAELQEAIDWSYTPNLKLLRIDARGLEFIDSSGLHCLITASTRCQELGASFEVIPSPQVARLCELTGVQFPSPQVHANR